MATRALARARHTRNRQPSTLGSLGLAVFPSALGWMAIVGQGDTLLRLTFGHDSYDAAMKALLADRRWWQAAGAAIESLDWNPPLVCRLQAYAEGAADDFL